MAMNPAHSSSSSSSSPGHHHNDSPAAAALRGAALAFQKKPAAEPQPSSSQNGARSRGNGALTAAAAVHGSGSSSSRGSRSPARAQTTGSGSGAGVLEVDSAAQGHAYGHQPPLLLPHPGAARVDPRSPSFIAATLAASRSASPGPRSSPALQHHPRGGDAVDSGSIAPTGSLISMFERARSGDGESTGTSAVEAQRLAVDRFMAAPPRTLPTTTTTTSPPAALRPPAATTGGSIQGAPSTARARSLAADAADPRARARDRESAPPPPAKTRKPSPPPAVRAPKQHKAQELASTSSTTPQSNPTPPAQAPKQPKPQEPASTSPTIRQPSPTPKRAPAKPPQKPLSVQPPSPSSVVTSTPEVLSPKPVRPVKPPRVTAVTSPPHVSAALAHQGRASPSPSPDPQKRGSPEAKQRPPTPPKPRGSQRLALNQPAGLARGFSDAPSSPYKASLNVPPASTRGSPASTSRDRRSPPPLPGRRLSVASAPSSPRRLTNASASNLQVESLADAIVAGSLASARLTPHNTGASLPPPALPSRRRSPRLLQTLRQPVASPDEDEDRGHHHRRKLRSGKHAHHEGSRKRWREEVTPRERKRYEAVWASNRGWLLERDADADADDAAECVANVAAREIWRRSRLPEDELAEVWDLVDRERRGALSRQEFVVGMWLLDQRLRGRKIPQRVSDSVWGSANGVSVKRPKAR